MMLLATTFILLLVHSTCSYNILVVNTWPGRSHHLTFSRVPKALAKKGYNVTVLGYFPEIQPIDNYESLEIEGLEVFAKEMESWSLFGNLKSDRLSMYSTQSDVFSAGNYACELLLKSERLQELLRRDNRYDLIMVEDFYSECTWPLVQKCECPVIRMISHSMAPWSGRKLGNPLGAAYVPNIHLPLNMEMSFIERFESFVLTVLNLWYYDYVAIPAQKNLSSKYIPVDEKTFDNRFFNASLVLINSHFSLNGQVPLVPNIVEVGGVHIGKAKKVPKDLEKWINESKDGVIFFSLGSVIMGKTMPENKKDAFLRAFKRLPQRVIWKWENDTMEGKSDNIRIGKWLPQFDILSHPNVKAFISHGGLLGTMEAVHSGTPMVVMPQFGDQHANAQAVAKAGGGVVLYMSEATEETIYQALKTVLEPKFQSQMEQLSERFRDRPLSPLDTAIYWVEYVARHKGAHFMKTAAVNMPFYQYYLLDVLAFIILVISVVCYTICIFVRTVIRKIFGSSNADPKKKQKKA